MDVRSRMGGQSCGMNRSGLLDREQTPGPAIGAGRGLASLLNPKAVECTGLTQEARGSCGSVWQC